MICDALSPLEAPALGEAATDGTCADLGLEVAGRAGLTWPDVGISRTLTLPRARGEIGLRHGWIAARAAVAAVRSGGASGYLGVDGEALLPEIQVAEARVGWGRFGIAVGAGVVDDPWVVSGDIAWDLRMVAPIAAELDGWNDRSDLGGWVAWTAPGRLLTARVDLTTGEGARFRERNEGKDLAGSLTAQTVDGTLAATVYGRDGSRGLGLAQDRRAGARVSARLGWVGLGGEALAAWGVDGDATRAPVAGSAWLTARGPGIALGFARLDVGSEDPATAGAAWGRLFVGGGVALGGPDRPASVLVGYQGDRIGPEVAAISGAEALSRTDTIWVQAGVLLDAHLDVTTLVAPR